jgi:uncharacterized protein (DUF2249 family)
MEPMTLVDQLRKSVGQAPICEGCEIKTDECFTPPKTPEPQWVHDITIREELDANALLDADKNPLAEVRIALRKLEEGEALLLIADFQPEPLIEEFDKQGFTMWTSEEIDGKFRTYIRK